MSIERPFELQVSDLWDAVLNLSLPAQDQLAILEAFGDREAVDELALALDDAFWVVDEAFNRNQLGRPEMETLNELNNALNRMSGQANADKWTPDGLVSDGAWDNIRQLARNALVKRQLSRVQKASA